MSDSELDPNVATDDPQRASALHRRPTAVRRWIRTVGFWAAVALPFVQVPLLVSGLKSTGDLLGFGLLIGVNLLALLLGHRHDAS